MKYKKCLTYTIILLLIGVIVAPNINAKLIIEKPLETEIEETKVMGTIYGSTNYLIGWGIYELPFALVVAESEGITVQDRSNIFSNYKISNLPLDKSYNVTASSDVIIERNGKYYKLIPETINVYLSSATPNFELVFALNCKETTNKEKIASSKIFENKQDQNDYGKIKGCTITYGFEPNNIIGAKIVLEGDNIAKRVTYTGLLGNYEFKDVPTGWQYTITASHQKYETKTKTVILTEEDPTVNIMFTLDLKDNIQSKSTYEEPECLGSIWGNTGELYIWGFSPVRFVKVEAGGKTTISGPFMGEYRIRNLPLGTYTVTGTKKGYETRTETVKLTEGHPDQQCFIHMEPNDESVNKERSISSIKSTLDTISKKQQGISNQLAEEISEDLKEQGFGLVLGTTSWKKGWCMGELPGVKVVVIGESVPRVKISNIFAHFQFILPIDNAYTITGTKSGYEGDSKTITLTKDEPLQFVDLVLEAHGNSKQSREKTESVKIEETPKQEVSNCFGTIIGKTGAYIWSGWGPVNNVKITIGSRTKYSNPHFFFTGLALGQTYTVTASKPGWKTQTKEVTLTEKNPIANIQFDLEDNGDKNEKIINQDNIVKTDKLLIKNCLFSSILIRANAWSNFFSTAAFMF